MDTTLDSKRLRGIWGTNRTTRTKTAACREDTGMSQGRRRRLQLVEEVVQATVDRFIWASYIHKQVIRIRIGIQITACLQLMPSVTTWPKKIFTSYFTLPKFYMATTIFFADGPPCLICWITRCFFFYSPSLRVLLKYRLNSYSQSLSPVCLLLNIFSPSAPHF